MSHFWLLVVVFVKYKAMYSRMASKLTFNYFWISVTLAYMRFSRVVVNTQNINIPVLVGAAIGSLPKFLRSFRERSNKLKGGTFKIYFN